MLSAFTAEPIIELKARGTKIESILTHGDYLLVGLSTGALRIYRNTANPVEESGAHNVEEREPARPATTTKPTELLREHDKFSKYKIEQLTIFKEANILISLSNGYVSIHDLATYELQETLVKTKGANLFAATSNIVKDSTTKVPTLVSRLAVAIRRRLLLWTWQDGELTQEAQETALSNSIKSLTWATGTRMVVGMDSKYVMLDTDSGEQKSIVGPGSIGGQPGQERGPGTLSYIGMSSMVPPPLATGLGADEMLLAKDVNTHFIDRAGESLSRRQIPWRGTPKAIGYSYPFLLALQEAKGGMLEVRNPQTLTLLQSIELPGANLLQVPNPSISLAHQGKGFLVGSDRVIWRMKGLHYDAQIDALARADKLDEAISLLNLIEETLVKDKVGTLREIKMQKAQKLFDQSKYRDALDLFSEVSAPPERVISLYPHIIAGEKSLTRPDSPIAVEKSASGSGKPASILSRDDKHDVRKKDPDALSMLNGHMANDKELRNAVRELQSFLADTRRRLGRFFQPDQSVRPLSELRQGPQAGDNDNVISYTLDLGDEKDQDIVTTRLLEAATLVDTTLFRAHMYATPSLAGSLFRIQNHCDPEVVMDKLEETDRYSELIDFLYGKGLHHDALTRLAKFGKSEHTDDVDTSLKGPNRTIAYLQNLPPELIDMILEFAQWPMEVDPEKGMQIFVTDTENAEHLPKDKVLDFLERIDKRYAIRYLEHIIDELDDQTPELHQRLIQFYFGKLSDLKGSPQAAPEVSDLKAKFLTHLKQSTQYSASRTLSLLPTDDPLFYEARAVVYAKMGQHRQALQIYVFKLNDTTKAEEYCNQVYLQESAKRSPSASRPATQRTQSTFQYLDKPTPADPTLDSGTIYALLLSLYLNPPISSSTSSPQAEPQIGSALSLLAKHGSRLPASATLDIIPTSLLVRELENYLRLRIRHTNTALNDGRIVTSLRKADAVRVQARLLLGSDRILGDPGVNRNEVSLSSDGQSAARVSEAEGRRRKVVIDEERVCRVCHKRLGGSVISAFPDGSVVHLGCQARRLAELGVPG